MQEHRPPGSPEQEIYDDGEAKLWDSCDVVAYFSLEVGKCAAYLRIATWFQRWSATQRVACLASSLPMDQKQEANGVHVQTDVESVVAIAEDALELGGGSLSWAVEAVANEAWVDQVWRGWGSNWGARTAACGSPDCCACCTPKPT